MMPWDWLLNLACFASGLAIGIVATNNKWGSNWMHPRRIMYCGSFYKVVRLDRWRESMGNLEIHEPPAPYSDKCRRCGRGGC